MYLCHIFIYFPVHISRLFCVSDELFCKSLQSKWHSPNEFTENSGHKMKIISWYVQEVKIQPQSLEN